MSAHMCSDADIHVLVDFARSGPPSRPLLFDWPPEDYFARSEMTKPQGVLRLNPHEFPTAFGRFLMLANWDSLEARYGSNRAEYFGNGGEIVTYLARRSPFMWAAMPGKAAEECGYVLKQLDHFDYQACEVENYRDTWAAKVTDGLRHDAIRRLPGYHAAPWGVPD